MATPKSGVPKFEQKPASEQEDSDATPNLGPKNIVENVIDEDATPDLGPKHTRNRSELGEELNEKRDPDATPNLRPRVEKVELSHVEQGTKPPQKSTWGAFGVSQRVGFSPNKPPRIQEKSETLQLEDSSDDPDATPQIGKKGPAKNLDTQVDNSRRIQEFPAVGSLYDDEENTPLLEQPTPSNQEIMAIPGPSFDERLQSYTRRAAFEYRERTREDDTTREDTTKENIRSRSGASQSFSDSLDGLRGEYLSFEDLQAVGVTGGSEQPSIELRMDPETQDLLDDLSAFSLTFAEQRAVRRLRYYDEVQQKFPPIQILGKQELTTSEEQEPGITKRDTEVEASEDMFSFDIFIKEPDESRSEHLSRVEKYMIGQRFKINNQNVVVEKAIAKHGGLSFGFIARVDSDTETPEGPGRRLFIKCVDLMSNIDLKGSSLQRTGDLEELHLLRDTQYKELDKMHEASQIITPNVPSIYGVAAFIEDPISHIDHAAELKRVNFTEAGEEQNIDSYFLDLHQDEHGLKVKDYALPNRFIIAMEYRGEDGDLSSSIEKFETQNNISSLAINSDLEKRTLEVLHLLYEDPDDAKFEINRIKEIYQYQDSIPKFMLLSSFWLDLLAGIEDMSDKAGARNAIKNELSLMYQKAEALRDQSREVVSPVLQEFSTVIDQLNDAGIIHRDIKPGNVLAEITSFNNDLTPIIIDFGLAENIPKEEFSEEKLTNVIIKECVDFLNYFDPVTAQKAETELSTFFSEDKGTDPMALYTQIENIVNRAVLMSDYTYRNGMNDNHAKEFLNSLLLVDIEEKDDYKLQKNERFCNLIAAYQYHKSGKSEAAALNVANPMEYTFKGRTYGTPEFSHPLTYLIASRGLEQKRINSHQRIKDLINLKSNTDHNFNIGQSLSRDDIEIIRTANKDRVNGLKTDLLRLDELLQDITDHSPAKKVLENQKDTINRKLFSEEISLRKMEDLLENFSEDRLNSYNFTKENINDLIGHALKEYNDVRTIEKLAAMAHRQQDLYGVGLTNLMVLCKVLFKQKESHPRFMTYSLKRAAHLWYPVISEVHQNLTNSKGEAFFPQDFYELLDVNSILDGDINDYMKSMGDRETAAQLFEQQDRFVSELSGKELLMLSNMLVSLESETKILYTEFSEYENKRTSLRKDILMIIKKLEDEHRGEERAKLNSELQEKRDLWEKENHLEEDFYKEKINTFKEQVLNSFSAIKELYQ